MTGGAVQGGLGGAVGANKNNRFLQDLYQQRQQQQMPNRRSSDSNTKLLELLKDSHQQVDLFLLSISRWKGIYYIVTLSIETTRD